MDERRRFERKSTSIRVEIMHPAFGTIVGFTQDISDGGASVLIENQPNPPVGTIVKVRFRRMVGAINEEPVAMKVMHHHRNVIGLMFTPQVATS
ncbi:PilZ domain-containing protein [Gilvimarinus sp. F26214L]|uniref:PilZ domain-containing protein n=1 Tax=Gilvimarinus sp. DZF01 TaxID=3461371 RepID=UPI0040457D04